MRHRLLSKNRFLGLLFFVIIMVAAIMAFAATRRVTLTTYYPAPYGKYNDLQSKTLSVSDKVGIGTTSPGVQLHMVNSASVGTHIKMENNDTGGRVWNILSSGTANSGGAGNLHIYDELAPITRLFIQGGTGNIGIGTTNVTSTSLLTLGNTDSSISTDSSDGLDNKSLVLDGGGSGGYHRGAAIGLYGNEYGVGNMQGMVLIRPGDVYTGGESGSFQVRTAGDNQRLVVNYNGNVGIGTTSPGSRLQVGTPGMNGREYMQVDMESSAPPSGDCDSQPEGGRIIYDDLAKRLYVCDGQDGWRYANTTK